MSLSMPATPLETLHKGAARHASVRWTLRVLRWAVTLAITFVGLLAVTFVIGRKVPIDRC